MSILRRRRHAELDTRVAEARAAAGAAREEARISQVRYEAVRANVVEPLNQAGRQNHFAAIIRADLIEGYGGGNP